jgi:hypothetical protein
VGFVHAPAVARWSLCLIVPAAITVLIVTDVTDPRFRRWWEERALTTSMVGGLHVLSVTVSTDHGGLVVQV